MAKVAKTKFEISKHFLVPKHSKLSEKDAEKILKKYNIKKGQLPKIIISDPSIEGLKLSLGDILKVSRISQTAGEIDFYRCVIDG